MKEFILAKGNVFREQILESHSKTAQQIAEIIIGLREFQEQNAKLLRMLAYGHDIGKKIKKTYKGNHKVDFDTCFREMKKEFQNEDDDILKIVTHLTLRHHYTSRRDISDLKDLNVPQNVNLDLILRNVEVCDWLSSMDYLNLADLDRIEKKLTPIKIFAYTISLEGILSGKLMDKIDEQIVKITNGKGIYFHNGSIFLFKNKNNFNFEEFKLKVVSSIKEFLDSPEVFRNLIGVGNEYMKTVIAPVEYLNSDNFGDVWERVLVEYDKKLTAKKPNRIAAYAIVQKACFEIFKYFSNHYFPTYDQKQKRVKFYKTEEVIKPILSLAKNVLSKEKINSNFDKLDYNDLKLIGDSIKKFIEDLEKNNPNRFKFNLLEDIINKLFDSYIIFWGEKPKDVQNFVKQSYDRYIETAKLKDIGNENKNEFCFICGDIANFQFRESMAKNIGNIAKIFSNRRPALANGIKNIKICPICLAEILFISKKLPSDISKCIYLYIEKPAMTKLPYLEIKEEFLDKVAYLELISNGKIDKIDMKYFEEAKSLFTQNENDSKFILCSNHFCFFIDKLPQDKIIESILYLIPFLYDLVQKTKYSVRIDIATNIDYSPIYNLLEIPVLSEKFTASDFNVPDGRLYKYYVLPVKFWLRLGIGNIIHFVKKFPTDWPHFLRKVVFYYDKREKGSKESYEYIKNNYQKIKEVYPMKEEDIFTLALKVSERLSKYGYSRYAITRPIQIIFDAILEAKRKHFDENIISDYATNRVLILSSKEIGREIKVEEGNKSPDKIKEEIRSIVKELAEKIKKYFDNNGLKNFIILNRYIRDALVVETRFGNTKD